MRQSRTLETLLAAVAATATAAAQLDPSPTKKPTDVSQRSWNAARYALLHQYGRLPAANEMLRQVSNRLGRPLRWNELLQIAWRTHECH